MNKKMALLTAVIAVLTTTAVVAGVSEASSGEGFMAKFKNKNMDPEKVQVMEQIHTLMQEGKVEEANALREEAGFPERGERAGKQNCGERSEFNKEHQDKMQAIMEAGDYTAFMELMSDKPMAENITEENFAKMVEAHNLKMAGDLEGAKAIHDELGLPGMRHGRGMRQNINIQK